MGKFGPGGLGAPDLSDDDPVWSKAKRRPKQRANRDLPGTLGVGRVSLEPNDMTGDSQFGGILDGDDSVAIRYLSGKKIEKSGFPSPGSSRDENCLSPSYQTSHLLDLSRCRRTHGDQVVKLVDGLGKTTDRHDRRIDGRRWNDGVKPAAIRESRINER